MSIVPFCLFLFWIIFPNNAHAEWRPDDFGGYVANNTTDSLFNGQLMVQCESGDQKGSGLSFHINVDIDDRVKGFLNSGYTSIARDGLSSVAYAKPTNYRMIVVNDRNRPLYLSGVGWLQKRLSGLQPGEKLDITGDSVFRSDKYVLAFRFSTMFGTVEDKFMRQTTFLEFRSVPAAYHLLEDASGNAILPDRLEWEYDIKIRFDVGNGVSALGVLAKDCREP